MAAKKSGTTLVAASHGKDANGATVLINALKDAAKDKFSQGIKSMTTDTDEMLAVVQRDFMEQPELYHNFKQLARTYRPVQVEAVVTVAALKDFADISSTKLVPKLEMALTHGSVSKTRQVLQELVETYGKVKTMLDKLKFQHTAFCGESMSISDDMAQREEQQNAKKDKASNNAACVAKGGGVGTAAAAVMIVATGAGPIGWACIGVSAILMAGAGGELAYENSSSSVHEKLKLSVQKISTHMVKVAGELDRQCKAVQMVAMKLEGACKSTASIQALVDSWGDAGNGAAMVATKLERACKSTASIQALVHSGGDTVAVNLSQGTSMVAAASGKDANGATVLINALKDAAKDQLLQGIKSTMTDLDDMMVMVQKDFMQQAEIYESFKKLSQMYRPIQMEALATVAALKDFADTSSTRLVPKLEEALTHGSVSKTRQVLQELVDTYGHVKNKLDKLKFQHTAISLESRAISDDMAQVEEHQNAKIDKAGHEADNAACAAGGAGIGTAVTAVVMVAATGSGPIGWACIGVSAAIAAAAGKKVADENQKSSGHKQLKLSVQKVSTHMYKVTKELDRQCVALQMVTTKLEGACKSTASIQALVDSWRDGEGKTKMGALKYKLWSTKQLPKDMEDISDSCKKYPTKETQRVPMTRNLHSSEKLSLKDD